MIAGCFQRICWRNWLVNEVTLAKVLEVEATLCMLRIFSLVGVSWSAPLWPKQHGGMEVGSFYGDCVGVIHGDDICAISMIAKRIVIHRCAHSVHRNLLSLEPNTEAASSGGTGKIWRVPPLSKNEHLQLGNQASWGLRTMSGKPKSLAKKMNACCS